MAQDQQQAAAWFQKAANQGHADAQLFLASMYRKGEWVKRNYQQALTWYRKAADQGDADAQLELGLMHARGEGVAKNDRQAVEWFNKVLAQPDTSKNAETKERARVEVYFAALRKSLAFQKMLKSKNAPR